jgi:hypothetical protein
MLILLVAKGEFMPVPSTVSDQPPTAKGVGL